jgi:hypothetical protein
LVVRRDAKQAVPGAEPSAKLAAASAQRAPARELLVENNLDVAGSVVDGDDGALETEGHPERVEVANAISEARHSVGVEEQRCVELRHRVALRKRMGVGGRRGEGERRGAETEHQWREEERGARREEERGGD